MLRYYILSQTPSDAAASELQDDINFVSIRYEKTT